MLRRPFRLDRQISRTSQIDGARDRLARPPKKEFSRIAIGAETVRARAGRFVRIGVQLWVRFKISDRMRAAPRDSPCRAIFPQLSLAIFQTAPSQRQPIGK